MLDFMSLFFNPSESDDLFRRVDGEVDWQQEQITLYGKTHDLPRETAWYGDANNELLSNVVYGILKRRPVFDRQFV